MTPSMNPRAYSSKAMQNGQPEGWPFFHGKKKPVGQLPPAKFTPQYPGQAKQPGAKKKQGVRLGCEHDIPAKVGWP